MFSTLKKLFGFENGPDSYNEAELISYATLALMGTGQYAFQAMTDDWAEWSKKMQNDLILFERKANEFKSLKLFVLAGKGCEKFSIWYRREKWR